MNFYQFHIGDYAKKTRHLTNEEDLAYRRLLDLYYDSECPLHTDGLPLLARRLGVGQQSLENVINEFFPNGRNKHADEKITEYHEYLRKQSENGKKGGRPKHKPTDNPPLSDGNPTPNQPQTNNQQPITIESTPLVVVKTDNVPFSRIVDLYHQTLPALPTVAELSAKRKALVRARWQSLKPVSLDDGLNEFECYFRRVSESKFLTGRTAANGDRKPFRANFEWLMNESNFLKVIEGNYHA